MNDRFFLWEGSPVMLRIGEMALPFSVSIPGLVISIVLFLALPSLLFGKQMDATAARAERKRRKKGKHKQSERTTSGQTEVDLPFWKSALLFIGLLIAGQLVNFVTPFLSFSTIGPIMLRWYGFLFAAAFLTGYFIGRKMFKDAGKPVELADRLLTYVLVGTIVGARLGHVLFYDLGYYSQNLHEILFLWQGGLASHGAAVGILLSLWLFIRNHRGITFFWLTDTLSMPVILGGAFIRTGNFFNSEIYGLPTELPWAVIFARIDLLPRHPTMLYEALICLVILATLAILYRYYRNRPPEGLLTAVFMIMLFTSRFFVEYTKVEQAPFTETWLIGMGQLLSIPFILFGIWVLRAKVFKASDRPSDPEKDAVPK